MGIQVIDIVGYGNITITIGEEEGFIETTLQKDRSNEQGIDMFESICLALACDGINLEEHVEALETALDAFYNHYD